MAEATLSQRDRRTGTACSRNRPAIHAEPSARARGEPFDAKIQEMSEHNKHHVEKEQSEVFPKARKTNLDRNALGARIAARNDGLPTHPALAERPPESAAAAAS